MPKITIFEVLITSGNTAIVVHNWVEKKLVSCLALNQNVGYKWLLVKFFCIILQTTLIYSVKATYVPKSTKVCLLFHMDTVKVGWIENKKSKFFTFKMPLLEAIWAEKYQAKNAWWSLKIRKMILCKGRNFELFPWPQRLNCNLEAEAKSRFYFVSSLM